MTGNKKAAGVYRPLTTSELFSTLYFTRIYYPKKVIVYRIAPWLFLMGVLHG